ncbi:MAG: glycosyl transferase family 2 [Frankiales bacterium]|nr:glycosyl transferase family 2 [Frankiales bacterium]
MAAADGNTEHDPVAVPLVSVIMIFRNAAKFFDEAIDSVLTQRYPAFELLLCDDGSSDSSTATARRRAALDPVRVRYLEHPEHAHRGMSSTRNLGLAASQGELVAFLDADDKWDPAHLAGEVALLIAHPEAGMVCGQAVDWHTWADPSAVDTASPLAWPPGVVVPPPGMLGALLRRGDLRTPTCNLLVRRSALEAVGGSHDEFRNMYEDQVLLARLYLTQVCVISGNRTAWYRRHEDSSSARAIRDGSYDPYLPSPTREAFLRWLSTLPQMQAEAAGGELSSLLAEALRPYEGLSSNESARPAYARLHHRRRTTAGSLVRRAGRATIPAAVRRRVRGLMRRVVGRGSTGMAAIGNVFPLSRQFGYDRGLPVDRFYIERFLAANAHAIAGRVLEVGDRYYTTRYGGDRVTHSDVLNIDPAIPDTTVVADLADGAGIAPESFDCLVITQTLHLLYDLRAAVATLHRSLSPGGTVLATFPGITAISTDRWADTWYWALTPLSAARLFGEVFGAANIEVVACGNVLTSTAFLYGIAAHELRAQDLELHDPQFPMLITVRAYRPLTAELPGTSR